MPWIVIFGFVHQFNLSTGAVIGTSVQGTVDGTLVRAMNGITWGSKQAFVIFRNPNNGDSGKRAYSSMTFDENGRLWIFVGNREPDAKTLFYTDSIVC